MPAVFSVSFVFILFTDTQPLKGCVSVFNYLQMPLVIFACKGFYPTSRLSLAIGQTLNSIIPALLMRVIVLHSCLPVAYAHCCFLNVSCNKNKENKMLPTISVSVVTVHRGLETDPLLNLIYIRYRPVSIICQAFENKSAVLAENLPFSSLWMNYSVMQDQQSYFGWFSPRWPRFTVNYSTISHKVRILGLRQHALLL